MAICIAVKYRGPTNHRGSRFTATVADWDGTKVRATVGYDHGLNPSDNAMAAAQAVMEKVNGLSYITPYDWDITPCGQHPTTGEDIFRAIGTKRMEA